ncbi:MAG: glycosyltransferase [Actinobacteria bacterium]|nr:glycosyltransferase [Actinomycetota bacterium]
MAVHSSTLVHPKPVRAIRRMAVVVVHSNPLQEPGAGDAGGMTVYVREIARTLSSRGIEVDIFTRQDRQGAELESRLYPGVKVFQLPAGDPLLSKEEVPAHLPEFACNVRRLVDDRSFSYDMIHSHYWLSGRVATKLSERWNVPFVHTFHTLGKAKNRSLQAGDLQEPEGRLTGEGRVIAEADAIVASTNEERDWLLNLYAAHPEKIHVISPGVDHLRFAPGDTAAAKRSFGLEGKKVLLFVGRLQPLKGPDTALRAFAHLIEWGRLSRDEAALLVVGGASGISGIDEPSRLKALAEDLSIAGSVRFVPAQPHQELPRFYQAADVLLVPSHTESFGLVALEGMASGVPVVGSAVGGLKAIVQHGHTGFLVEPDAAHTFAERAWQILSDPLLRETMSRLAVCSSEDYSWHRSAADLHSVYMSC